MALGGFLDDFYATLIVKLAYCGAFQLEELWRDAADFESLAQSKKMGVKLLRKEDGCGKLRVWSAAFTRSALFCRAAASPTG